MAEYNFNSIENKWQKRWEETQAYKAQDTSDKPKYYALDMFPYPSGAGLHVGHPLGYIASDIVSRFKRLEGFNVLHPIGFDAFGLPAEQYAIQTGQHPAITTEENIKRYKSQLKNIGFAFDWDREVQTCDPEFYRWTQWIFKQLYSSWYNNVTDKAEPIETLISEFESNGNNQVNAACEEDVASFTAEEWSSYSDQERFQVLNKYRLTYHAEAMVNWCPGLGTVLANDEVKDGFSERGGFPVERKLMKQWMMRITAYAERLLNNLQKLDWSSSMVDMQTNWIGKSEGSEINFDVVDKEITLTAFTTRPDTIYGVTYMVIAPEHELISQLTSEDQQEEVNKYVEAATRRSERERMAETKVVSGVFSGSYVINPFTNEKVQLWIADYVLAGYGTGVVMAVPSSDDRDHKFAKHFNLPIRCVIAGTEDLEDPTEKKHGKMINSGDLNGLESSEAIRKVIDQVVERGIGAAKINYKIRDAVFSRQRYWGEPVPVYFSEGIPQLLDTNDLPLVLPPVDEYKPTEQGDAPLARATDWKHKGTYDYEYTTMPGWAGSSWYFLRYMDPHNEKEFVDRQIVDYWNEVDLYIGGTEHATGHLLYSRFWNMFLYDRDFIGHEEPFKKLVNQGMIQGRSSIAYRTKEGNTFVSKGRAKDHTDLVPIHVDVSLVQNDELDITAFKNWRPDLADASFELEGDKFICDFEVEKMSKRLYNVVNPDDIIEQYGADTLRLYEMFLGPLEQSKPWDTNGIDGVFRFLKKLWNLFHLSGEFGVSEEKPTDEELKILHKTIKKTRDDIERLSFNTSVSGFMICINELGSKKCNKREVLNDLLIIVSPFAPHICEELWEMMGNHGSILDAKYPEHNEAYLEEASFEYPIMINGKMRTKISFSADASNDFMEEETLKSEVVQKWLEGKAPKKVIIVPKRIINIVV